MRLAVATSKYNKLATLPLKRLKSNPSISSSSKELVAYRDRVIIEIKVIIRRWFLHLQMKNVKNCTKMILKKVLHMSIGTLKRNYGDFRKKLRLDLRIQL